MNKNYLLLGALFASSSILAQNNLELPTIKISASSVQEEVTTSYVTNQEIENKQIHSLSDLSRYEAGLNFGRKNKSISIRGLDSKRVLTNIDGIRTPWMTTGPRGNDGGIDAFDFNSLNQVEVLRGAEATKQGSNALGGSLQLSTLNAEDILGTSNFVSKIKADYVSVDNSYGINGALAAKEANTTYLLQLGYRDGNELKNKGTINDYNYKRSKPNPENNTQGNILFKAGISFDEHQLKFTTEYYDREQEVDFRTAQGPGTPPSSSTTYEIGQNTTTEYVKRQRLSLDHTWHNNSSGFIDNLNSTVYWQKINKHNDQNGLRRNNPDFRASMPVGGPMGINAIVKARTGVDPNLTTNPYAVFSGFPYGNFRRDVHINKQIYGLNSHVDSNFELFKFDNSVTLGLELSQTNTKQLVKGADNCPQGITIDPIVTKALGPPSCMALHGNQADIPKTDSSNWAVYANDLIALNNAVSVTPTIRYDYQQHKPKLTSMFAHSAHPMNFAEFEKKTFSKFTASVQALWQINDFDYAYGAISQGFRTPEVNELYMNYGAVGTYIFLGDPNLKAETSTNYELGFSFGEQDWRTKLVLFSSYYHDFIEPGTPSDADIIKRGLNPSDYPIARTQPANLDKVRIYGTEFNSHYQVTPNLKLFNSIAYAHGIDRKTNKHLNSVAPLTAIWGVNFAQENSYGADVVLRTVAKRDKVKTNNDFKAPGFATVDLNSYVIPTKNTKLQFGIYNILDKKYWEALNVPDVVESFGPNPASLPQPEDFYTEGGINAKVAFIWQY